MEEVKPQAAIKSKIDLILSSIDSHETLIRLNRPGTDICMLHELVQDLWHKYELWANALRWESLL